MGEWKRIFNLRIISLVILLVVGNVCLFTYSQLHGRSFLETKTAVTQHRFLVDRYQGMKFADALSRIELESSAIRSDVKSQNNQNEKSRHILPQYEEQEKKQSDADNKYLNDSGVQEMIGYYRNMNASEKNQMDLELKEMKAKLKYLNEYENNISQIMQNAVGLKKFSIFSKPNSFSYHNILKIAHDFERVDGLTLTLNNDKGVEKFLQDYYIFYIAFAFMVVILYSLFNERENGMWCMVHSYARGRLPLAVKRAVLIAGSSLFITGLLYVTTLFASFVLYGGWDCLPAPIQSIEAYYKFTFRYTQLHYLVNNFFISWFAIFTVSIVLWMFFVLFRNRNHVLLFVGAFSGIEVLLYNKIEVQSAYNAFKYVNLVKAFRMNEIYGTYNNWGFGRHVYSVFSITCLVLLLLLIISVFVAVIKSARMRPHTRQTLIGKFFMFLNIQYQKCFTRIPVIFKEIHKLIITGKGIWVVFSVIIIVAYFTANGRMSFTDSQKEKDRMYTEHGGKDFSYITEYVEQQKAEYQEIYNQVQGIVSQYENGEVDLKTYSSALNNLSFAGGKLKSIDEYENKITYLNVIREKYGIEGYMISDRGYEEIFGQYSRQRELILLLVLVTGIMLIISECISMEYRTGMENIVRSCKKGRGWLFSRKMAANMLFTIFLFIIIYGIDLWILNAFYGFPYLNAPLMSLTFMEGSMFKVSILMYMIIRLLIRFLICIFTMLIAVVVSRIMGKKGNRALMPLVLVAVLALIIIFHGVGGII